MRYQLLALDLDGTTLDPYGNLTDGVHRAIDAALEQGLRVVLCTGRRFRTALPFAERLGLEGPIVVNNGVVVKDIASGETLADRYLPGEVRGDVLELVGEVAAPLVYLDTYPETVEILTVESGSTHPYQVEYLREAGGEQVETVPSLDPIPRDDVIMISTMGDSEHLDALRERARGRLGSRIHTHLITNKNFQGQILEFLAPGSDKWSALEQLASQAGISRGEIVAVGDDVNDIGMIRGAGLGIAMGNAVPAARAAADLVVRSNAEGGLIEAIERVILKLRH